MKENRRGGRGEGGGGGRKEEREGEEQGKGIIKSQKEKEKKWRREDLQRNVIRKRLEGVQKLFCDCDALCVPQPKTPHSHRSPRLFWGTGGSMGKH